MYKNTIKIIIGTDIHHITADTALTKNISITNSKSKSMFSLPINRHSMNIIKNSTKAIEKQPIVEKIKLTIIIKNLETME